MDNERIGDFQYSPLGATTATIRLVYLSREFNGSIICKLEHFSLDSLDCPKFKTLSYVWGEMTYSNEAILNGHCFPVLGSLYPVLELICDTPYLRASWWWIDSICINQHNDTAAKQERSSQVQLMERIYKESAMTMGWLGPGSDGGEEAMEFLHVLVKNRKKLGSEAQREVVQNLSNREKWAAVEKLMLRPWWRRVWTLQEYIIPKRFIFYCGTKCIARKDFKVATYSIYLCRQIDDTLLSMKTFQPAWNRRRLYQWKLAGFTMPLIALIAYGCDSNVTDPRDRIYSVLGMAKDRVVAEPTEYNTDIDKIYSKLVVSFVETYKSLDIICFADNFNSLSVRPAILPALPSWVPDWRARPEAFVVPVMASQSAGPHIGNFRPADRVELSSEATLYAAAGNVPLDAKFLNHLRILICKGILFDYVDGIGAVKVAGKDGCSGRHGLEEMHNCINSTSAINMPKKLATEDKNCHPDKLESSMSSKLMDDVSRCLVLNRKDRYLSYATPPRHFYREFQAFYLEAIKESHYDPPPSRDWFQLNKSIFIRGHSLEEWCNAAEIADFSERERYEWLEKPGETSFLSRFKDTTESMARRLITTNNGHIGMAPFRVQKGDQICVLFGCSIPLILRQRKDDSSYEVVGECYLHGYMNGEALEELHGNGKLKIESFWLS